MNKPTYLVDGVNWERGVYQREEAKIAECTTPIPPCEVGRCMVPPQGRIWFHTYDPGRDGPLVECFYPTAKY